MSFFKPSHTTSSDADSSRSANSPFVGIQAKLNIGKSNDKYEKEADAVADKVVNKDGIFGNQPFLAPSPSVQRSDDQELQKSEETEQIQEKPIAESITPLVQRKEDEEVQQKSQEEEVQMMADEEVQQKEEEEVQTKEEDEVQKQSEEESIQKQPEENDIQQKLIPERDTGEASVQRKGTETSNSSDVSPIQRKDDEIQEKEEEIQEKEDEEVQRSSSVDTGDTSNLENNLQSSKGGGSPMDDSTRSQMESGFGADFSGVRIHNDSNAVQMNKDLGAQAFANGNDIYFNEGKYDPSSKDGQHLLAHELTHTIQQGASPHANVQKATDAAQPEDVPATKPTTPIDISHRLNLTDAWSKYLDEQYASGNRKFEVDVKIGERYSGTIELSKKSGTAEGELAKYEITKGTEKNFLNINGWGFLQPLRDAGIDPVLVLNKFGDEQQTTGFLSVAVKGIAVGNAKGFIDSLNENLDKMGFLGIEPITITDGFENTFEQGRLIFKVGAMTTVVDGFLEAGGGLGITGDTFTFNVNAKVDVAGLASGELMLARGESGKLSGKLDIEAEIANVNAKLMVEYIEGAVTIQGTGKIQSEKFSGEITLLVTDAVKSKQMMNAALGVEAMDTEKDEAGTPAAKPAPKTKENQVLAGWGEVTANITPWLSGTAKVGIDSEGHVTIVGEITVPDDVELMEQRGKKVDLFKVEIRAGYGIPLVGQVFLFASIGMFMNAGFGPLVLKNVGFKGTYSTDPSVLQEFEITGTLNINAFAIIGLEAEAGVGVTILGHDVKAGVNVTAAAGLRAYAEATPTLEYKEQQSPQGGKVGESRLKGHFEAAAQLFMQLSGSLFYELDSPWWSPAPDGREDYPLGEVQYPIGDSMGIGADMDWLIGSPEIPELKFSPVEFDPDKFTADVMADPPPGKKGKSEENKPGKWEDKNKPAEKKDPPEQKDGKGIEGSDKKKEDLKKLPDQQKYMRSLDEMSKLEKADPKPTLEVVKAKASKVKSKYGIDSITVKDKKDQAEISVKHKKDNNKNNILKVPLMSAAERYKLLKKTMDDLKVRNKKEGGKEGKIEESKAKELINAWKKAHPVVEEVRVVDGGKTWDYFVDIGDKSNTETGLLKAEVDPAKEGVDTSKLDAEGKKFIQGVLAMKEPFVNVSKEKHNLDFEQQGKDIILYRKSIPVDVKVHADKIAAAIKKEEDTEVKEEAKQALKEITKAHAAVMKVINEEVEPLFKRTKTGDDGSTEEVKKTGFTIQMGKQIKAYLGKIADELAKVPEIDEKGKFIAGTSQERPVSKNVVFNSTTLTLADGTASTDGISMTAAVLSRRGPGNTKGSQPNSAGYSELYDVLIQNGRKVVAAHLLNHQLFGKGNSTENLTPIPAAKNTKMEADIEAPVKKKVLEENEVVYYQVTVSYTKTSVSGQTASGGSIPEDDLIADNISATAYTLKPIEGTTGDDLKNPDKWTQKDKDIPTTDVGISKSDLVIKKDGATDIDFMATMLGKIDKFFSTEPKGNWSWDVFVKRNESALQKATGVKKGYGKTDIGKTIKQEFTKKQSSLGDNADIRGAQTYDEVLINAKRHAEALISGLDSLSGVTTASLVAHINSNKNNLRTDKTSLEAYLNGDNRRSIKGISFEPIARLKKAIEGVATDEIEKEKFKAKLIQDLKPTMAQLFISAWSLVNENNADATQAIYDALVARIVQWNQEFPTKKLGELEESLEKIRTDDNGSNKFLSIAEANQKQRSEIKKLMQDSKARLKLKQGDSNTEYQKLTLELQKDQDSFDEVFATDGGREELETLRDASLSRYVKSRTGKKYNDMNLSESQRITIENMHGTLISQLTAYLASK